MGESMDVKETKEAVLALVLLGKFVADRLKDGVGMDDAAALFAKLADEEFKAKVAAGVDGLDKVPAELGDLQVADMLELVKLVPEILEILQKPA